MAARTSFFTVCLVALGVGVFAPPRVAGQYIAGTAHDFSEKTPGGRVCIACHVPHGAAGSSLLWNHELSASTFSWGSETRTAGGTLLPSNVRTWSGSSKHCLSCHDGTVEIGSTLTPPYSWDGALVTGRNRISLEGGHPVAIPYPYGNVKNTYNGIRTGDNVVLSAYNGAPTRVKIYDDLSGGTNNRGIECGSCHDPHGTAERDFLRDTTEGSSLCLNCHVS